MSAYLDRDGLLHRLEEALQGLALPGHFNLDVLRELCQLLQAGL